MAGWYVCTQEGCGKIADHILEHPCATCECKGCKVQGVLMQESLRDWLWQNSFDEEIDVTPYERMLANGRFRERIKRELERQWAELKGERCDACEAERTMNRRIVKDVLQRARGEA